MPDFRTDAHLKLRVSPGTLPLSGFHRSLPQCRASSPIFKAISAHVGPGPSCPPVARPPPTHSSENLPGRVLDGQGEWSGDFAFAFCVSDAPGWVLGSTEGLGIGRSSQRPGPASIKPVRCAEAKGLQNSSSFDAWEQSCSHCSLGWGVLGSLGFPSCAELGVQRASPGQMHPAWP